MWRIWRAPNNASRWQIGFISAFKGLKDPKVEIIHHNSELKKRVVNTGLFEMDVGILTTAISFSRYNPT